MLNLRHTIKYTIQVLVIVAILFNAPGPITIQAKSTEINNQNGVLTPPIYSAPAPEHPLSRVVDRREPKVAPTEVRDPIIPISTQTPVINPLITPVAPNLPKESLSIKQDSLSLQNSTSELLTESVPVGGIDWVLNGYADSTAIQGAIKITDDEYMQSGSAWSVQQVDLSQNFDMTFSFHLGDKDGADGMAFVLQNMGTDALGDVGRGIGYWHITPSIEVEFDTYFNPEQNDPWNSIGGYNTHNHVALMKNGNINHVDDTYPLLMPWTPFEDGDLYPFRFQWDATAKTLLLTSPGSTWFSYTEDIVQTIFGGDSTVWFGITGATAADRNFQYFYPNATEFEESTTFSSDPGMDGNISCIATCTQGYEGGPINTRTGGYDYSVKDISFQTNSGEISFERIYSSLATNRYWTNLGYGWTHNHDLYLSIGQYDSNTNLRALTLKGNTANQYIFMQRNGYDYTTPYTPGVFATLVAGPSSFILTDKAQNVYEFNLTTGKLISHTNPTGQKILYTYDSRGRLIKISDQSGLRFLTLAYSGKGTLIASITDHTGRKVTYGYDTSGNLASVKDTQLKSWPYTYDTSHHLLQVLDPNNAIIERTEYDANGRAIKQYDGAGNLVVELIYNADGTTSVKDAFNHIETHTYDMRKTLTSQTDPAGVTLNTTYDPNFRPATISDSANNTTSLTWSGDGADLTQIIDPLNGQVDITYDANHNPTSIIDPLSRETKYFYQDPNFPTLLTRIEYPLSFDGGLTYIGTDYVYYQPGNPNGQPAGKLKLVTDALGHQTFYTYTTSGQVSTVTTGYGTDGSQTTSYLYDNLGNMTDQTAQGITTHNVYDPAGRVTKSIRNYDPAHGLNEANLYNLTTEYTFDARGNQIAIKAPDGVITRTYFNLADKPFAMVQNLIGQTIEATTPPERGSIPDQNLRTDYTYDIEGTLIATTDPAGIIERTFYDAAGRPQTVVRNLYGQAPEVETVPPYDYAYPDRNIRTDTVYDSTGNVIATINNPRVVTRTYYNELNLPVYVVQNLVGQDITNPNPPSPGTGDENLVTEMRYDANGNVIATIDPSGMITRTYYDAMNRPETIVQNIDLVEYPLDNPAKPDRPLADVAVVENIRTDTYYDQVGNVIATQDPRGIITRTYFDAANRPYAVIVNLVGQDIYVNTPPASGDNETNIRTGLTYDLYGRKATDVDSLGRVTRYDYDLLSQITKVTANYLAGQPQNYQGKYNLVTANTYDLNSQVMETTDTLNRVTLNSYDQVGRLLTTTRNYLTGQGPNYQNQYNIMTSYAYDSSGNRLSTTDANGHTSWTNYDDLNRPETMTDSEGHVTINHYDPIGNLNWVWDAMLHLTIYTYDDLGRQTSIRDPLEHTTWYEYDANGNRTAVIDPKQVVTRFEYDKLNRLSAVVENYLPGFNPTAEVNVRTEYSYDANGNRLTQLDGNQHETSFEYDALNRLRYEHDPLAHTWQSIYDTAGNRELFIDANGQTTDYIYDEIGRLATIDYQDPATADVSFTYDALGKRLTMQDAAGTTTWSYDQLDRITSVLDPFDHQVKYAYDPVGNKTTLTYPDLREVAYSYDSDNHLDTVEGLSTLVSYTYDDADRLTDVTRQNGLSSSYVYDDADRLLTITHIFNTQNYAQYDYTYDDAGNRTQAVENIAFPEEMLPTPTPTATETPVPTDTATELPSPTPTDTLSSTETETPTFTPTETWTPTFTPTLTPTQLGFINGRISLASLRLAPKTPTPTRTRTPTNTPTLTPTTTPTATPEGPTDTPTITLTPTNTATPPPAPVIQSITIDYTYDPLYRLTAADYSDGKFYHYTYDSVGNRLTQQSHLGDHSYIYDDANRLTNVDSRTYAWDDSGNLTNDGTDSFGYDAANRLVSVNGFTIYTYNGLGDRLSQSGVQYTLDLNAGLTEVIDDGTNAYLYGLGRIAENESGANEYYLGDALGSVRQLVNTYGGITLNKSYDPFGDDLQSLGASETMYGFTGETTDANGLIYLRSRYYSPEEGRFTSRDTWEGDFFKPMSYNLWLYAYANPLLFTDPSGRNPLLAALLPSLIGAAAGFAVGVLAGGAFGYAIYPWALAGECGCELQIQALAAGGNRWAFAWSMALPAGIIGGIGGAIAGAGPIGLIAVGALGIYLSGADFIRTYNIIRNETGITYCTVARMFLDVVGIAFSALGIAKGIQAWRSSGSGLGWRNLTSPRPTYKAIPDDAFVRFDPSEFDSSINGSGLRTSYSNGRLWLVRFRDVKGILSATDLETILYRQNLWSSTVGKFSQGATLRWIRINSATPAGVTNMVNGIPQWFITYDIPPSLFELVGSLTP